MRIDPESVLGRGITIGILLFGIVGLAAAIGPARTYVADTRDSITTNAAMLARLEGVVAFGQANPSGVSTTDMSAYQGDFLHGEQDAIIVAELQNRLRAMAMGRSTELNSANALPSKSIGPHTYLGLRVVLRGHLRDIQHILHGIETSTPLLFVDRAVMRLDARPMNTGDPALDAVPALVAEFDVYGARAPTPAKARP